MANIEFPCPECEADLTPLLTTEDAIAIVNDSTPEELLRIYEALMLKLGRLGVDPEFEAENFGDELYNDFFVKLKRSFKLKELESIFNEDLRENLTLKSLKELREARDEGRISL